MDKWDKLKLVIKNEKSNALKFHDDIMNNFCDSFIKIMDDIEKQEKETNQNDSNSRR